MRKENTHSATAATASMDVSDIVFARLSSLLIIHAEVVHMFGQLTEGLLNDVIRAVSPCSLALPVPQNAVSKHPSQVVSFSKLATQSEELTLAHAEICPIFFHDCVQTERGARNHSLEMRLLERLPQRGRGVAVEGVEVKSNRA